MVGEMIRYLTARYSDGKICAFFDGNGQPKESPQSIDTFLVNVGKNGWELCASLPDGDGVKLVFKKAIR